MSRQRLVDRVDLGIQRPLTLISAPAGFGKSVLVDSWAESYRGPALVRRIAPATDGEPADLLKSVHQVLRADDRQTLVLVVDCGDRMITAEFGRDLDRLLRGYAGRFRVILLTRYDPPLPLHQYRLADAIAEIQAEDLAFTTDEVAALTRAFGLNLTGDQLADLHARTGGWPVGLVFAAMNLAGKSDPGRAIREFRGDTGNVAAYLMAEVLDSQPPELRKFLLRTSLVDVVTPGLAEVLTAHRCDLRSLQFLARGNSFIQPVAGTTDGYSYLALFREFLRAEVLYEEPALVPSLHSAAAAWFARNGQPLEAMHHAVTAGDWRQAARYLVANPDTVAVLIGRRRRQASALLAGFPDEFEGPEPAIARAVLALAEFDVARGTSELRRSDAAVARSDAQDAALVIGMLRAVCATLRPATAADLDGVLATEGRLGTVVPGSPAFHPEARLLIIGCKGRILLRRGDFPAAASAFEDGIALAEDTGADEVLTEFLGLAALAEAIRGRLRRTGELVARATALTAPGTPPGLPRSTLVAAAWMHTDRGEPAAAEELLHRVEDAADSRPDSLIVRAACALVLARQLRARGDVQPAIDELRAARDELRGHGGWFDQALVHEESNLRTGEPVVGQPPAVDDPLDTQVNSWLVQAAEAVRAGNKARGDLYLERALRLAAPEQLRRPFAEAPAVLRQLLEPTGEAARHHAWLRTPSDREPGRAAERHGRSRDQLVITSALTGKEQEVLGYLADLLTTEEIADTMFVSVNTVRSHVRSILRKLGASRRNEAVRRAWELGLLPAQPEN
ncbi:LuxR C-terminal-related transcriptional regulator [Kribbella sp. NPDC048915]|uniref:helix-turn-helix transcriptional regulator n=1 Tax=Kribbella sp. NPDC048915 TaxID=3155148 RepID=UPI0033F00696